MHTYEPLPSHARFRATLRRWDQHQQAAAYELERAPACIVPIRTWACVTRKKLDLGRKFLLTILFDIDLLIKSKSVSVHSHVFVSMID